MTIAALGTGPKEGEGCVKHTVPIQTQLMAQLTVIELAL